MKLKGFIALGITFFCVPLFILLLLPVQSCKRDSQSSYSSSYVYDILGKGKRDLFTIRYRLKWLHQAQFAGAYMAKEKGFYQKRGLNVEILPGGADYPPYESLVQGKSDISNINLISAIENYHTGTPLVNLAQISQKNSTQIVGKKSSKIVKIEDLQGRKVGLWRGEASDQARLFFDHLGIEPQTVDIDWSVNLLLNDAIDAMNVMEYNEYHRLLMAGLDKDELFVFDLSDYGFDLVDDGLYATRDYYNQHKRECIAFAEATMEGWVYALSHQDETLDIIMRYLKESHLPANRSHQAWMLEKMRDKIYDNRTPVGYLNPADFDTAQNLLLQQGWMSRPVEYKDFFPNEKAEKK